MQILRSSPERLVDPESISLLVLHFSRHLGNRFAEQVSDDTRVVDEISRLRIVPLVFGLLPRPALLRPRYDIPVKPLIIKHLNALDVPADGRLVDVLKCVADQYRRTLPGPERPRKWGIADAKASDMRVYRNLISRQCGRCVYCGAGFSGSVDESLDHVVPWRLVGDIGSGSNWQILCRDCNMGKSSFLSCAQSQESFNWIYSDDEKLSFDQPNLRTRFSALAQQGLCSELGCTENSRTSRLHVVPRIKDALSVVDHLKVICDVHFSGSSQNS